MKVKVLKNKHFFLKRSLERRMSVKTTRDVYKNINESHISIVSERDGRFIDGKVGLIPVKQPDIKLDSN